MGRVRFGAYEVDRHARELRKNGVRIRLENQPFEILLALLEHPGELVSRSDLQHRIWRDDTFVDFEKSLTKAVNKLRSALCDSATTPRYIETLSRRGYRFIAPVEAFVASPFFASTAPEVAAIPETESARPRTRVLWRMRAAAAVLGCAVIAAVGLASRRAAPLPHITSLAVLPFENLTGDARYEPFVDGLTDQLISHLSRIGSITVISRTSAMRYKSVRRSMGDIARELHVNGIIEGSVHNSSGGLLVNVRLMQAPEDRQLWSNSYSGESVKTDIALAVAHQISSLISAEDRSRLAKVMRRARNPAAYEAYLRGRQLWNQRKAQSISEAESYFRQALTEDPGFALAWSGLSDCHTIGWGGTNRDFARGEECARKAIALEPDLAEGHISLALALMCRYRYVEAEAELKLGVQLSPNNVAAHQFLTIWFLTMNRLTEALAESDRALQIDPFSIPVNNMRSYVLTGLRQYDRALEQARATASISPETAGLFEPSARIYWLVNRPGEALAAERHMANLAKHSKWSVVTADAQAALKHRGAAAAARVLARGFAEMGAMQLPFSRFRIALAYGNVKSVDQTLQWLEGQIDRGGYENAMLIQSAPEFEFLRGHPRFSNLLRRAGVSPPR